MCIIFEKPTSIWIQQIPANRGNRFSICKISLSINLQIHILSHLILLLNFIWTLSHLHWTSITSTPTSSNGQHPSSVWYVHQNPRWPCSLQIIHIQIGFHPIFCSHNFCCVDIHHQQYICLYSSIVKGPSPLRPDTIQIVLIEIVFVLSFDYQNCNEPNCIVSW